MSLELKQIQTKLISYQYRKKMFLHAEDSEMFRTFVSGFGIEIEPDKIDIFIKRKMFLHEKDSEMFRTYCE